MTYGEGALGTSKLVAMSFSANKVAVVMQVVFVSTSVAVCMRDILVGIDTPHRSLKPNTRHVDSSSSIAWNQLIYTFVAF